MIGLVVLLWVVCVPLLLWTLMSPESAWRRTTAWRYRDPAAQEPSAAGYGAQRASAGFGLLMVVVVTAMLLAFAADQRRAADRKAAQGPPGSVPSYIVGYRPGAGNELVLSAEEQYVPLGEGLPDCLLTAQVVAQDADRVVVAARMEPVVGTEHCDVTPGHYHDVTVTLDAPLGDRAVVNQDGGRVDRTKG
jgi:hypothetical protein